MVFQVSEYGKGCEFVNYLDVFLNMMRGKMFC